MLNPRVELAITLAFMSLILLALYFTSQIDLAFSSDLETFSGPRAYPGLILGVLLFLNFGVAVSQIRGVRDELRATTEPFFSERSKWAGVLFALLLIFVLTFEPVGYILTMVPLLIGVAFLCGAQRPVWAVIVAVGLTAVCLVTFRYGLSTVLPEGVFGIDAAF